MSDLYTFNVNDILAANDVAQNGMAGNVPTATTPAGAAPPPADGTTPTATLPAGTPPTATPPASPNARQINQNNVTNPTLPDGTEFVPTPQTVGQGEMLEADKYKVGAPKPLPTATATATQAAAPKPVGAETVEATTISGQTPQVAAEQGQVSQQAQVEAAQQQGLSPELKAEFDSFKSELDAIGVDANMTVQGQYSKLMADTADGQVPPWANLAYKKAKEEMARRGISGSTTAGNAITTALMQAALPIAAQDAQVFKDLKLATLDKKAQATFLKAGYIAQLDTNNLNNRQQAAVYNAQAFLAMDMKNLDNRQQSAIINTQARLQTLMSDQAAINTAKQFNASSINQVNQFYADLGARTEQFNASQTNAMSQFNASQTNAMGQFNQALEIDRQKFNTSNAMAIDQSNTQYLRNINTANTALKNQANMYNTQNLLNISNTALANEIQLYRDNAAYLFQANESSLDRANAIAVTSMQNEEWFKRYNKQQKDSFWSGVGNFLFDVGKDILSDFDFSGGNGDS